MPSTRSSLRSRLALAGILAIVLTAALGSRAAAEELPPPPSGESTETAPAQAPTVSIQFTRQTASLTGSRALVHVKCAGSAEAACIGTLALQAPSGAHKVPYSIERGAGQILVVPVGDDGPTLQLLKSVRVVARTLQSSGASVDTSRLLRIR